MSSEFTDFQVGDWVRLKTGYAVLIVTEVSPDGRYLSARYRSTQHSQDARVCSDFYLVHRPAPKEEPMATLYKTKDGNFGTLLTKDSQGNLVLELKGSPGGVKAYAASEVEEVVPHTVQITFAAGPTLHFEVAEGLLEKHDLVIDHLNIGRVTHVNTRCKTAQPLPDRIVKLVTKPLE